MVGLNKFFSVAGFVGAFCVSVALFGDGDTDGPPDEKKLLDVAGEQGDLGAFLRALEGTELLEKLQGEGPYTLFAPNDEAFDLLPDEVLNQLMAPEQRHFRTRLLAHHVIADTVTSETHRGDGEQRLETYAGTGLTVISEAGTFYVETAEVKKKDLETANGILHVIDRILVPRN